MALPVNAIGPFNFISLGFPGDNAVAPPSGQMQCEITERPGVDGTGLIQLGIRGEPYPCRTTVDVPTLPDCHILYQDYLSIVGTRQLLMRANIAYEQVHRANVFVLKVEAPRFKRLSAMSGGLNGLPAGWFVEVVWQLISVPAA